MSETFVLASDLGSSACKTMLVGEDGRVVATARQGFHTHRPQPGWAEQDPEDWYQGFCATVRAVLEQSAIPPARVAAVGMVGVTHNTVLLDAAGIALRPSILIFDRRSTTQAERLARRWGPQIRARALNDVSSLWSWPQLLWIREMQSQVWNATRRILFQKDYVRDRLATSPVTDTIDAAGSLFFDPLAQEWIEPFVEDLGISMEKLPGIVSPLEIVGGVSPQGARDSGLLEGTPVIAGTTDTAAEVLGAGALRPGVGIVKLASVGRIAVVAAEPVQRPHVLNYRHVLDGLWYPGTASKFAASAYQWLSEALWPDLDGADLYRRMDDAAAEIPPGSAGLLFYPHLNGEWAPHWDDRMRGGFVGVTARHSRAHLTRSVLEGVALSLRDALSELEEAGLRAEEFRLIGQGARSDLWSRIVGDVLNRPLRVPRQIDAVYGCALITLMGAGLAPATPELLESRIEVRRSIRPDPETAAIYQSLFEVYREGDRALRGVYHRMDEFEKQRVATCTVC